MNFKEQYKEYQNIIENRIKAFFKEKDMPQKSVLNAMRYAITAGGKRIRPVMTLAAADVCNADMNDAEYVALAVECIHNYSLVHDDLPCMDNDDLRRGRPTCHKVFPEEIALLAGDGLLNTAFEILSDEAVFKSLKSERVLKIINRMSSASGVYGMIGGQVVDLECEDRNDVSLEELKYLHENKTGQLIRAALVCGCLCGDAETTDRYISIFDEYGKHLGMAFQIKDDILDVEGDEAVLGKPIGSDKDCNKNTFVTLLGAESAKECLKSETELAKAALEPLGEKKRFFEDMADFLLERRY